MRTNQYTVTTPFQRNLLDYYLRALIQSYLQMTSSLSVSSHHNVLADVILLREQHEKVMEIQTYPSKIDLAYSLRPDLIVALVNKSILGKKWSQSNNPEMRFVGQNECRESISLSELVQSIPEPVYKEDLHFDDKDAI